MNTFYHGDCLFVMKHDIEPESIDLIYLDPPFFTGKIQKGTAKWQPGAMEVSYEDSKHFWKEKGLALHAPQWLKYIALKRPDFAAYLFYIKERLEACHRALKKTGSIYLHCDWHASHYIKMLLDRDDLFGYKNFRNEIVWHYDIGTAPKKDLKRKHDIIFRYSKSKDYTYNEQRIAPLNPERYNKIELDGRRYFIRGDSGKRCYLNEGISPDDVWTFIREKDFRALNSMAKERLGYPTQKPLALLERIILASSNEGDIVLDPFCGCGTAVIAAQKLNRQWIGIDINKAAYEVTGKRYGELPLVFTHFDYVSRNLNEVAEMDGRAFEIWVNEFYKATKPQPDRGVDGITQDGIPIQSKVYEIKHDKLSQFINDAKYHPKVPKPIKKILAVSQSGFDDSARKLKFGIETQEKIEVQLITPKEMLTLETIL